MPRTWLPGTVEEFKAMADEITLPAFVKLRTSASGVGIRRVKTKEELVDTFEEFVERYKPPVGDLPLIQGAVPGEDYCVTTLFDHGELRACMTYHNLRAFPADRSHLSRAGGRRVRLGWHRRSR